MIYDLYQVLTAKLWQAPQGANFESISENVDIHSTNEYNWEIISERQFVPIVTTQLYEGMESDSEWDHDDMLVIPLTLYSLRQHNLLYS